MATALCHRAATAAIGAAVAVLAAGGAVAQDVRVNQYTGDNSEPFGVATDGATARFVFDPWWRFCAKTDSIAMRQMDLEGHFLTADTLAQETCGCVHDLERASIAALASGAFIVTWIDGCLEPFYVEARIFDGSGVPLTGDFQVNTTNGMDCHEPYAVAHPDGKFVVAWSEGGFNSPVKVYARIVRLDGSTPAPAVELPSSPALGHVQWLPRLGILSSGSVIAGWLDSDGKITGAGIMTRRFDRDLAPLGPDSAVNQTAMRGDTSIGLGGSGDSYVFAWGKPATGPTDYDVMGRRFLESVGAVGNEFWVNTYTLDVQGGPTCVVDGQGRALIVWGSHDQDGYTFGVYGQRFDAQGGKLGSEFRINMTVWDSQLPTGIAMLPTGDFVVAFGSSTGPGWYNEMAERRFFFPVSLALAPGPGASNPPWVTTKRPDGSMAWPRFTAFGASGYGTTVGTGDIDGDALSEIVAGPGPSPVYGPQVRAFRRDGTAIAKIDFYAYGTLKYGVKEGGAGVDGDPYSEIVTTPGPGAVFGPHVRGWNFDNATLQPIQKISFFAFNTLRYGANASRGGIDADAFDEILATPGPGAIFGAQLRGFNYDNTAVTSIGKINAYAFSSSYGATVSSADIDSDGVGGYLDGYDEIVVGRGPGPANDSEMRVFDYGDGGAFALTQRWAQASPLPYTSMYGLNVAGGDVDAGDTQEIATGPGPDPAAPAHVLCWEWNPLQGYNPLGPTLDTIGTDDFIAFQGPPQLTYGVNVAVGKFE